MGGMDLDMNDSNFDFNDSRGMPSASATPGQAPVDSHTPGTSSTPAQQPPAQPQQPRPQEATSLTDTPVMAGGDAGEASMFPDSTFDDFTNMDDGPGGDDLVDFGAGGVGEESMFGDALHGMDAGGEGGERDVEGQ